MLRYRPAELTQYDMRPPASTRSGGPAIVGSRRFAASSAMRPAWAMVRGSTSTTTPPALQPAAAEKIVSKSFGSRTGRR